MLALKTILASADEVNTLIFDEIDAGIGAGQYGHRRKTGCYRQGKSGNLRYTSASNSLYGRYPLFHRQGRQGRTCVLIVTRLRDSDRVREIARMLGGHPELTATSIKHAKEMLKIG